jgi:hypothetical protein
MPVKKKPATNYVAGFTIRSPTPLVTTSGYRILASTVSGTGPRELRYHLPGTQRSAWTGLPPGNLSHDKSTNGATDGAKNIGFSFPVMTATEQLWHKIFPKMTSKFDRHLRQIWQNMTFESDIWSI